MERTMNLKELRRKIQEKTFVVDNKTVPNIEVICSIQTENILIYF